MCNKVSGFTKKRVTRIFPYALLIICVLATTGPFIWMLASSFKHARDISTLVPNLLPVDKVTGKIYVPTMENYEQAIEYLDFGRMFLNSFLITSIITILNVLFNSMAAFAFARIPFRGKNPVFYVMLASLMLPSTVTRLLVRGRVFAVATLSNIRRNSFSKPSAELTVSNQPPVVAES